MNIRLIFPLWVTGHSYTSSRPHSEPMVKQYTMISHKYTPSWSSYLDYFNSSTAHTTYTSNWNFTILITYTYTHYSFPTNLNMNRSPTKSYM